MRAQRVLLSQAAVGAALGLVAVVSLAQTTVDVVPVGNPGNANHGTYGRGAVAYPYWIGKFEVNNAQYAAFLNAVDANGSDPYDLHVSTMRIAYSGGVYAPTSGYENKPVAQMNYWGCCRFANWLHNRQPVRQLVGGYNASDAVVNAGAYTLTQSSVDNNTVTRNTDWIWAVPSENEWYKAAFHKNDGVTGNYWLYPTQSGNAPSSEVPPGTDLVKGAANFKSAVGNVTDCGAYNTQSGGTYVSDSAYGTFDQGGNCWEWNESLPTAATRNLRGAGYTSGNSADLGASVAGLSQNPATYRQAYSGFRVVYSNPPLRGSLVLMR